MTSKWMVVVFAILGLAGCSRSPQAALDDAAKTMGATNLKSIQYSGSGAFYSLGQNVNPNDPWPKANLQTYSCWIDYEGQASREELVRDGGFRPHLTQFVSGSSAWVTVGDDPKPLPTPDGVSERQLQILLTPHGFLKAAKADSPTVTQQTQDGKKVTIVSFTALGKYPVTGRINDQNLVDSVEAQFPNPVLGDMSIKNTYSNYKDFGGVQFPTRIVQEEGSYPTLELNVSNVQPNATASVSVPDAARQATAAPKVASEKIADGVWFVGGGSHNSMAVEYKDFVAVVEGPLSDERSRAVIAEVKKLIPDKPIRYVVSTHHHFDHSGGLRTYVAEGATIVTPEIDRPLYEKVFQAPHTLDPDSLSKAPAQPKFEFFSDKHELSDGTRKMELYAIEGNPHAADIILVYLPKEKILCEADLFNPGGPAGAEPPAGAQNPLAANLYGNIQRLKLDVKQIVPIHGHVVPITELRKAAGPAA